MRSPCCLSVCLYMHLPYQLWMPEPVFMKHVTSQFPRSSQCVCTCIAPYRCQGTARWTCSRCNRYNEHYNNYPMRYFLCCSYRVKGVSMVLSVNSLIVARQRLGEHAPAATKDCSRRRFLCGPWRIKEIRLVVLPRISVFVWIRFIWRISIKFSLSVRNSIKPENTSFINDYKKLLFPLGLNEMLIERRYNLDPSGLRVRSLNSI
jgi:hypothetical protein